MTKRRKQRIGVAAQYAGLLAPLRKLSGDGVTLRTGGKGEGCHLIRRTARATLGAGRISTRQFETLRTRGLIERIAGGDWRLSAAGHACLRRVLVGEDGFIEQHSSITVARIPNGGNSDTIRLNTAESPLAWLRRRKDKTGEPILSDAQFAAGERLRGDFTKAHLMPRLGPSWSAVPAGEKRSGASGAQAELLDHVLDARRRVSRALDAVGNEFANILVDICCLLHGLEAVENDYGWPRRSCKLVLQLALSALARHYGLSAAPHGAYAGGDIRHWGGECYRPPLE